MGRPADAIYLALKSSIQTGRLAPGEHLVEENLRAQYGVSRTPVRNALRRLSEDGLVTIETNRGAFVASWTDSDATEVMAIRSMLEPYAAQRAAERRTDSQLTELYALCDRMEACATEQASDFRDELAHSNHEFHLLVLQCAASPRLYSIAANLARAPMMLGSFQLYNSHQLGRSLQDHRELTNAIALRDAAAARAVMEAHLRLSYLALTAAPAPPQCQRG
ncbi:GntR family transcriptional regulator [Streptomyces rhizosphaericus]|uniref:GntR family transcriptional regulator n=1 Tax=Streptomyces rhizosphaericus TaxID=114699 RepID=A0A6G4AVX2_9ACTN|nr:GntR family transcriptional regulator [Streptomyces rhizosphaericus]NEW77412.1 GntR family transcriptional regulator [Streptomyces rhizosphaericus]